MILSVEFLDVLSCTKKKFFTEKGTQWIVKILIKCLFCSF